MGGGLNWNALKTSESLSILLFFSAAAPSVLHFWIWKGEQEAWVPSLPPPLCTAYPPYPATGSRHEHESPIRSPSVHRSKIKLMRICICNQPSPSPLLTSDLAIVSSSPMIIWARERERQHQMNSRIFATYVMSCKLRGISVHLDLYLSGIRSLPLFPSSISPLPSTSIQV